jgi:hypothetical protein
VLAIEFNENLCVDAVARWSREDRTGVEFSTAVDIAVACAMPRLLAS